MRTTKEPPAQLTLADALKARDEAMQQVEENAELVSPDFSERAQQFILAYLQRHGACSGEVLTNACLQAGIRPHDDRAFGPVYMRLSRSRKIEKAGFCVRKKGHGTAGGNIWKLSQ